MKLLVLVVVVACVKLSTQEDYCNAALCPKKGPHIACNGLTKLAASCGAGAKEVTMTSDYQNLIVKTHNNLRNTIAQGKQTPYKTAVRMPTMQWDSDLASIAAANARRCVYGHDACRNTKAYPKSGQNIAMSTYSGMTQPDATWITEFIEGWYSEYEIANPTVIDSYPNNWTGDDIGHFTQVVADRADRVGCSMVYYKTTDTKGRQSDNALFVCNYSLTNIVGQPVYVAGPTASKCTTGTNKDYPGLCSTKEVVSPII